MNLAQLFGTFAGNEFSMHISLSHLTVDISVPEVGILIATFRQNF